MAFTQFGSNEYQFGFGDGGEAASIAAAVGLKPQTLSVSSTPEFTAEGKDENGQTAAFVVGDPKRTFTLSGVVVDDDLFNADGATFSYDGNYFIVTDRKIDTSNTDFKKGELTGVSYPLISGVA